VAGKYTARRLRRGGKITRGVIAWRENIPRVVAGKYPARRRLTGTYHARVVAGTYPTRNTKNKWRENTKGSEKRDLLHRLLAQTGAKGSFAPVRANNRCKRPCA
jgi:hypothetical protein